MKKIKLLSVIAFCLIITMLLSSCGIMKKNDFSTQKYTNFKKGRTTVNVNQVNKEKKEAEIAYVIPGKNEMPENNIVTTDNPSKAITTTIPEIKKEPVKTVNNNIILKETKKDKINRAVSLLKSRFVNKTNTTSYNDNGHGLSLFWIVILILLIIWALGLGFGVGALINVLLVIALILLILWLLEIV
jgi:preprotein translocase subunit SecF